MFRTIASLLLFASLSPVAGPSDVSTDTFILDITPPATLSHLQVSGAFSASGAIVIDVLTGKELFGVHADEPRAIGSLAKLMTAIITLEHHDLSELVTIPRSVEGVMGTVAGLRPGDRYTVENLLAAMLVASANDAAHTLAVEHSDSIALFAEAMNERAKMLGLTRTHFENPVGYDSPLQVSTPRELAWLSMYALKNDTIRTLTGKRGVTISDQSGENKLVLYSTNRLLSSHPSSFFGLKTGTTDAAGQCLISLTYARGRPYLFIVLKSNDRYQDTLELLASLSRASV